MLGAHQLIEMVYQMVSRTDAETERFLNDVILLCVHANPDGMELVSNWYMREKDPMKRSLAGVPRLYNKYAGHDDNRDLYMSNLAESTCRSRGCCRGRCTSGRAAAAPASERCFGSFSRMYQFDTSSMPSGFACTRG